MEIELCTNKYRIDQSEINPRSIRDQYEINTKSIQNMNKESKGYQLLFANIAILTVFYLLLDFSLRRWNIQVHESLFWGWGGAAILSSPFFLIPKKTRKNVSKEWKANKKLIIGMSIVNAIASFLFTYGILHTGSGPTVLLENMQVIFGIMLGIIFLGEKFNHKEILAAIIMLLGVILIANLKGETPLIAGISVVCSSFFYALQSLLFKKFGGTSHVLSFSFLRGCTCAIIIVSIVIIQKKVDIIPITAIITLSTIYALGMLLSRYFFYNAHRLLSISKINMMQLLQPAGVLIGTFIFFKDPISIQKIGGSIIILGGAFLLIYKRKKIITLLDEE